MTVVGLHPEELFDKLLDGELSPAERERLRQHLDGCSVCRFEYAARLDFEREALALGGSPPPLMPVRITPVAAPPARRRRRRLLMWGLAAAALITASGALASVVAGRPVWQSVSLLVSQRAAPAAPAQRPQVAKVRASEQVAVAPAVAPAPVAELARAVEAAPVAAARPGARSSHAASLHQAVAVKAQLPSGESATKEPVAAASKDAASKEPAAKEPAPAAKLFAEANQARRAGDFGRAAGLYHLLQDQYPGSAEAELSRVTLALLQLDSGDARGALTGFERYLAGSSRGLEAEALVGRARALGRLGRRDLEVAAWQEVQRKYPRSIYGRQASERLLSLGQP